MAFFKYGDCEGCGCQDVQFVLDEVNRVLHCNECGHEQEVMGQLWEGELEPRASDI